MRGDRKRFRRLAFTLFLLATAFSSSGCALGILAAGAGAGAVAYVTGDVEKRYPYPVEVVWDATMASLAQMELGIGNAAMDQLGGRVEAYTAVGDTVKIILTGEGEVTSISVRVNTFGNKTMSRAILRQIDQRLGPSHFEPPSFGGPTPTYGGPTGRFP